MPRRPTGSEGDDRVRAPSGKKTVVMTAAMPTSAGWFIHGVDFTSRPRLRKPITVASGRWQNDAFHLDAIAGYSDWRQFEYWLGHPGPWIAGFDFPFGLP